jgi:hypothetical protein
VDAEGILQTIAELSVALAGFASVVIALRGAEPERWAPQDRFGLGIVLASSLGALTGSLLPFPLGAFGLAAETIWRASTGLLGIAVGIASVVLVNRGLRHPPRTPRLFWSYVASGALFALVLLAHATGLFGPRGPGLLLLGLIWLLLAAFAQLFTFLMFT